MAALATRSISSALVCAILLSCSSVAQGQSLAAAARAAAARNREAAATQPARVYTNKDLPTLSDVPTPAVVPDPAPPAATAASPDAPDATEAPEQTEQYWKERMRPLREQLDRDRQLLEASQARAAALTAEADQCFRIGIVCVQYMDSLAEQDESRRLLAEVQRDERAVRALEEEARRAGIPPGWLRP